MAVLPGVEGDLVDCLGLSEATMSEVTALLETGCYNKRIKHSQLRGFINKEC